MDKSEKRSRVGPEKSSGPARMMPGRQRGAAYSPRPENRRGYVLRSRCDDILLHEQVVLFAPLFHTEDIVVDVADLYRAVRRPAGEVHRVGAVPMDAQNRDIALLAKVLVQTGVVGAQQVCGIESSLILPSRRARALTSRLLSVFPLPPERAPSTCRLSCPPLAKVKSICTALPCMLMKSCR